MRKSITATLLAGVCGLLTACAAPKVHEYQAAKPELDLVRYFSGQTEAWGMFQQRGGKVVKRFKVDITGTYQQGALVLDERFVYDDGSTQQRVWTLRQGSDGRWRGTAADVEGEALGEVAGNALNWRYTLRLPVDGKTYHMQFDDWMFLIDEKTMINRASMSKFGIELGEVTLFFRKKE
ncbi:MULTISPECIES: DUF3833 domain-containing protein [Chitinibacter]|uniref:DUF3833 domain-containing protein n=1 Tax=Chitinibacter TaxID=230666 RepID=UPI00041E7487|nr:MULTISPECIES: DUF3833 domain-containing protein [Chitinibacter]